MYRSQFVKQAYLTNRSKQCTRVRRNNIEYIIPPMSYIDLRRFFNEVPTRDEEQMDNILDKYLCMRYLLEYNHQTAMEKLQKVHMKYNFTRTPYYIHIPTKWPLE